MPSRKGSAPPPNRPPSLTISRAEARRRLSERIGLGKKLLEPPESALMSLLSTESDFDRWSEFNRDMLGRIFTTDRYAQDYDFSGYKETGMTVSLGPSFRGGGRPAFDMRAKVTPRLECLESILDRIDMIDEPVVASAAADVDLTRERRKPGAGEIFIVHGHDTPAKIEVARFIERAGLKAIVLHEQPNSGRTIIEKFEDHGGAASFAVVVATPDDIGGESGLVVGKLRPRARQNVIAEMAWFAGRLGRDRVCVLKKGDIEMPSDFAGVGYTEMDDRGAWRVELVKELQAAGYEGDWLKAIM